MSRSRSRRLLGVSLLLPLIALAPHAAAGGGVIEINQTCAVATGCLPGDSPGFPVSVNAPGSYRLTSDLVTQFVDTSGIEIGANNVSIDLGGFMIVRPGCENATTDCTPTLGTGTGIASSDLSLVGHEIASGSVVGMASDGVVLGSQSRASGIRVRWNRGDGISVGSGSSVAHCSARENHDQGIVTADSSTISDSLAIGNGGAGVQVGDDARVTDSVARDNGGEGIAVGGNAVVSGNTVRGNGTDGILAGVASVVSGNATRENGGRGIFAGAGSTIEGNSSVENSGHGIQGETASIIRGNTTRRNLERGIDARFGTQILDNVAYDNGDGEVDDDGIACLGGCTISRNTTRSNDGFGIRAGAADSSYRENTASLNGQGPVSGGTDLGDNLLN